MKTEGLMMKAGLRQKAARVTKLSLAASAAMLVAAPASATDVFNLIGFGAISRGLGGSGVARDIGPAGMMYNPATLALQEDGNEVLVGVDFIHTNIDAFNTATGEHATSRQRNQNRGTYFAPQAAFTHKSGRLTLGAGAFAQGGLGTEYGTKSFLSRTSVNSVDTGLENDTRLLNLRIVGAAAYQVTDKLTIGGSLDAVWSSLNLGLLLDVSQVGALAADGRVNGTLVPTLLGVPGLSGAHFDFAKNGIVGGGIEGWGLGGKVGATYQVTPQTRLGIAYNFKTNVGHLSGSAALSAVSSVPGSSGGAARVAAEGAGNVNSNITLPGRLRVSNFENPAQLSIGISQELGPKTTLSLDYQRVYWSKVFKNIDVHFDHTASGQFINILLPQNFRDINAFKGGIEYKANDRWTLRGGASWAQLAIPNNTLFAIIPAQPQFHLTAGFTTKFGKAKRQMVDVAIIRAFKKTVTNSSQPNTSVPLRVTHSQINITASYRIRF